MLDGARFVLCSSNEGLEGCGLMLSEAKGWLLLVLLAGVRFALRSLQCRTRFVFVRCPQPVRPSIFALLLLFAALVQPRQHPAAPGRPKQAVSGKEGAPCLTGQHNLAADFCQP